MDMHVIWFVLLGVLLAGYGVLDGFDLGVGILHFCAKNDEERRIFMQSIGPVWDGNEVWLVTFGGALFAAFPNAYAAAFSGFYLPFMALLCALIFRGISIEFRSKHPHTHWRGFFDLAFCLSSVGICFLFGVAVGDTILGLPVEAHGDFIGTLQDVFRPYALMVGLFSIAVCAMHGSIYLYLKTEGDLQKRMHSVMWSTFGSFLVLYMLTTLFTVITIPSSIANFQHFPWAWGIAVLNILAVANIPRCIFSSKPGQAFLSSAATIMGLTALFGVALFPNLLRSTIKESYSLTIYNAASSETTLWIMFWIAMMGIPFVIAYTCIVYWVFRGKVKREDLLY